MRRESPKRRSRRLTWYAPDPETAEAMDGLEYLYALREGRIPPPPVWSLLDCRLVEIEKGRAILEMAPAEHLHNRFGRVQGGILCAVLDAAMACALGSDIPPGRRFTSPEIKVSYFRPVTAETGALRCEGTVTHMGKRIAFLEARMSDGAGMLYAHASSTFMIFRSTDRTEGKGGG